MQTRPIPVYGPGVRRGRLKTPVVRMKPMPNALRALPLMVCAVLMAAAPALADGFQAPAGRTGQSADGQNRRVRIHNQTGWVLTGLQVTDVRREDWRAATLGRDAVPTGDSVMVNVDDGAGSCVYLIRAEFSNGQTLERTNVNACQIADYYFTR